jgi:hypothetical protein
MIDLDIVARLRRLPPSPSAYGERRAAELNEADRREAADEIERLRAALQRIANIAWAALEGLP